MQSHGPKASACFAMGFGGQHSREGYDLQPEEHRGATPPPAATLTRATGQGRGCLATSAFPSVRRKAPYQQKAPSVRASAHPSPGGCTALSCSGGRNGESRATSKPSHPHNLIHRNSPLAFLHHNDTPEPQALLNEPACDALVSTEWCSVAGRGRWAPPRAPLYCVPQPGCCSTAGDRAVASHRAQPHPPFALRRISQKRFGSATTVK